MTNTTANLIPVGTKVMANGYPGTVIENHAGDELLEGMVTVKLEAGEIITSADNALPL